MESDERGTQIEMKQSEKKRKKSKRQKISLRLKVKVNRKCVGEKWSDEEKCENGKVEIRVKQTQAIFRFVYISMKLLFAEHWPRRQRKTNYRKTNEKNKIKCKNYKERNIKWTTRFYFWLFFFLFFFLPSFIKTDKLSFAQTNERTNRQIVNFNHRISFLKNKIENGESWWPSNVLVRSAAFSWASGKRHFLSPRIRSN